MNEHSNSRRVAIVAVIVAILAALAAVLVSLVAPGGATGGQPRTGIAPHLSPSKQPPSSSSSSSSTSTPRRPVHGGPAHGSSTTSRPPSAGDSSSAGSSAHPTPHHDAPFTDWHVTASVRGPEGNHSFCPVSMSYTAIITVNHLPADVTYVWSDGTATGPVTEHVTHSPWLVGRTLTASESLSGSIGIQVVAPVAVSSNVVHFDVSCISVHVATATTSPAAYTGDCSRGITFTTSVAVKVIDGPVVLHYRWVRSDGGVSAVQTASFGPGTSIQTISNTWFRTVSLGAGAPEHAWQQLQILDGPGYTSNQSSFDLWCV